MIYFAVSWKALHNYVFGKWYMNKVQHWYPDLRALTTDLIIWKFYNKFRRNGKAKEKVSFNLRLGHNSPRLDICAVSVMKLWLSTMSEGHGSSTFLVVTATWSNTGHLHKRPPPASWTLGLRSPTGLPHSDREDLDEERMSSSLKLTAIIRTQQRDQCQTLCE